MFKKCITALSLSALLIQSAFAASLTKTPTGLQPGDVSTLAAFLTAGATSLTLNPVTKYPNGVKTKGCFNTGSGFILIQDSSGRQEYASFGSKSCSALFTTTLSDLTRGLSPTSVTFTGGTGLAFDAGTSVKVIDYPIVYNRTAKIDLPNTTVGSGSYICGSVSQPCIIMNGHTVAQQAAFTFGLSAGKYPLDFNTTTGVMTYWNGSSWVNFGSGSTVNASETVAGKVQIANSGAIAGSTATGSTGAFNVLPSKLVTGSGGIRYRGFIPRVGKEGFLSGSLLGTGTRSITTFLRGDQTFGPPAASGVTLNVNKFVSSNIGSLGSQTYAAIDSSNLSATMSFSAGDVIMINFQGTVRHVTGVGGTTILDTQVGNNPIGAVGSGATVIPIGDADFGGKPAGFTQFHQVMTGGSLTVRPVYRIFGAGTVEFRPNTLFQVIKIH